jgi:hypothetical protein
MCNIWTGEHTFMCSGSSTVSTPSDDAACQCNLLTWGQARELALKAMYDAETRRQKEREQEAKWWSDVADR